jgi:membrane associated rhomboid family serine protease
VYEFQFLLSVEYCLVAVSVLNEAVTVTFWLVGAAVLAQAVGFIGGIVSMLVTSYLVTSETMPAAFMPRK